MRLKPFTSCWGRTDPGRPRRRAAAEAAASLQAAEKLIMLASSFDKLRMRCCNIKRLHLMVSLSNHGPQPYGEPVEPWAACFFSHLLEHRKLNRHREAAAPPRRSRAASTT